MSIEEIIKDQQKLIDILLSEKEKWAIEKSMMNREIEKLRIEKAELIDELSWNTC